MLVGPAFFMLYGYFQCSDHASGSGSADVKGNCKIAKPVNMVVSSGTFVSSSTTTTYTIPCKPSGMVVTPFSSIDEYVTFKPSKYAKKGSQSKLSLSQDTVICSPGWGVLFETVSAGNVCTGKLGLVFGQSTMNCAVERSR